MTCNHFESNRILANRILRILHIFTFFITIDYNSTLSVYFTKLKFILQNYFYCYYNITKIIVGLNKLL